MKSILFASLFIACNEHTPLKYLEGKSIEEKAAVTRCYEAQAWSGEKQCRYGVVIINVLKDEDQKITELAVQEKCKYMYTDRSSGSKKAIARCVLGASYYLEELNQVFEN